MKRADVKIQEKLQFHFVTQKNKWNAAKQLLKRSHLTSHT